MSAPFRLPYELLQQTFAHFRSCGCGCRECQVLWVSPWSSPDLLTETVHPVHEDHFGGFVLDSAWLNAFWLRLGETSTGIRVQIHTHPMTAFHSSIDDEYPIIHRPGFLSLVIPNFGLGAVGFDDAFLTEIQLDGSWKRVPIASRLVLE